jgi:hypothetical protein
LSWRRKLLVELASYLAPTQTVFVRENGKDAVNKGHVRACEGCA